jgi:hypothetical protein
MLPIAPPARQQAILHGLRALQLDDRITIASPIRQVP